MVSEPTTPFATDRDASTAQGIHREHLKQREQRESEINPNSCFSNLSNSVESTESIYDFSM